MGLTGKTMGLKKDTMGLEKSMNGAVIYLHFYSSQWGLSRCIYLYFLTEKVLIAMSFYFVIYSLFQKIKHILR